MNDLDPITIGAVATAAGSLLTIACTKGIAAWRTWRETNHKIEAAVCHDDDERADAWANVVITRQQEEIAALRSDVRALQEEMKVMRQERLECERVQAELKTEVAYLRRQVQA